jgi:hypothetical protein
MHARGYIRWDAHFSSACQATLPGSAGAPARFPAADLGLPAVGQKDRKAGFDLEDNLSQALEADDPRSCYTDPLPIPRNAEGEIWDLLRMVQQRFMGDKTDAVQGGDGADERKSPTAGLQQEGESEVEDEAEQGKSWRERMRTAQTNIKAPPESVYTMEAMLGVYVCLSEGSIACASCVGGGVFRRTGCRAMEGVRQE